MVNLLSICSDYAIVHYLYIIKKVLGIIQFIAPIIAVLMLSIRFLGAMVTVDNNKQNNDKNNKKIINIFIALIIIYFIPMLVNLVMIILSDVGVSKASSLSSCWLEVDNIYKPSIYDPNIQSSSTGQLVIKAIKSKSTSKQTSNNKNNISDDNKIINGKKYKLTNSEIKYLAAVCLKEQGSTSGMRGEANLIANRYELYGKGKYSSPADYVKNSGWFGTSSATPTNNKTAINVVKSVFVQGNRTIPLYVDEHDCWFCNRRNTCSNGNLGDICTITGGSSKSYITNRKKYKQDKTIIKNTYGSTYTFYYFPSPTSDPFGYTETAYKKVKAMNK